MKYSTLTWREPWRTPIYDAQAFTTKIARIYAGNTRNISPVSALVKPPYCLRIVRKYRTRSMQAFRDNVARISRNVYRNKP